MTCSFLEKIIPACLNLPIGRKRTLTENSGVHPCVIAFCRREAQWGANDALELG